MQDLFGRGPIKRTEPLVKKAKKQTETGIHSDEEFEKSLLEVDVGSSLNTKNIKSPKINHGTASKTDVSKNKSPFKVTVDHKSKGKKEHKHENKDKHKEFKRDHKEENSNEDFKTKDVKKDHKDRTHNGGSLMDRNSKTKDTDSKTDHGQIEEPYTDRNKAISNAFQNQKEKKIDKELKEKTQEKKTPVKKENGTPSKEKKADFSVFLESDIFVLEDHDTPKSKKRKMNNSLNETGEVVL